MDLSQLIREVARAKSDLAELQRDENLSAERLAPCIAATKNLEEATSELLTTAWVPRDPTELLAAIQCANRNVRSVQSDIAPRWMWCCSNVGVMNFIAHSLG